MTKSTVTVADARQLLSKAAAAVPELGSAKSAGSLTVFEVKGSEISRIEARLELGKAAGKKGQEVEQISLTATKVRRVGGSWFDKARTFQRDRDSGFSEESLAKALAGMAAEATKAESERKALLHHAGEAQKQVDAVCKKVAILFAKQKPAPVRVFDNTWKALARNEAPVEVKVISPGVVNIHA